MFMGVFLLSGLGKPDILLKPARAALADHAVINEIHIDSVAGTGGTEDDWVELYNPTSAAISLDGWSIQKSAGTGGSIVRQDLSGTIAAGGYFLIVRDGAVTAQALKDAADLLAGDSFSLAANNIVYLVGNNVTITGADDPDIIDFVGYGTALFYEGTGPAPAITETKSISRVPDGEDTDDNGTDFVLLDIPTPTNSSAGSGAGNDLGGTVVLTVTVDPVQNITPTSADIVFKLNTAGVARVVYGQDNTYGSVTNVFEAGENETKTISLMNLECGRDYHYAVEAENLAGAQTDTSADAVFTTMPCGIGLDSLVMTKENARASNAYADGWVWEFDLTVYDLAETSLKMKFFSWTKANHTISAGGNMRFSVDNGANWVDVTADNAYPTVGADISAIDLSANAGRQVKVLVQMKVPSATPAGYYASSYGILTE